MPVNVNEISETTLSLLSCLVNQEGYSSTINTIEALRRLNRTDIRLVGYDISPAAVQAVKDGLCQALLYQNPYQQGYQAASLLARYLLEGWRPPEERLLIETKLVFRQNIRNYENGRTLWDQAVL